MLKIQALILALFCSTALAETSGLNLQLPTQTGNYQSDKFRVGDLDCSNAIGGATNLELGVTGIVDNAVGPFDNPDPLNPETKDIGLYARIIIPLDAPKERISCNRLFELELRKRRLEVLKLEQELRNLQQFRFNQ